MLATFPLRNYIECDHHAALYKNQLVSYRYPAVPIQMEYERTLFATILESRRNQYVFEHGGKTHNEFLLTGADMQNFHLRLISRNYKWDDSMEVFDSKQVPYPLPPESLWSIQLAITLLQGQ